MKAKIEILKGAPPRTLRIEGGQPVIIGRAKDAELQILSSLVSRQHCELTYNGKVWILKDLDSRNGTWVDTERIRTRALADGDIFTLGKRIAVQLTIPVARTAENEDEFDAELCAFCHEPIERGDAKEKGPEETPYHKGCREVFGLIGADLGGIRLVERVGGRRPVHRIRAHQPSLNRNVLLYAFDSGTIAAGGFQDKLLGEVRAVSKLLHPKIIQIHDLLEERGAALVVTEYFPGESLQTVLRKRKFVKVPSALSITAQIVDGLAYAEGQERFLDRLSPADIVTNPQDMAKLDMFRPPISRGVDVSKLAYLAPEVISSGAYRASAKPVSPEDGARASRSSVYCMGSIFYHMLAGIPPHEGDTEEVLLPKILKKMPPALSRVNLKVSPALARLVERMMDKDAGARPPDFRTLQADLRKITSPGR